MSEKCHKNIEITKAILFDAAFEGFFLNNEIDVEIEQEEISYSDESSNWLDEYTENKETEMDSKIDAGEFIVFRDGNYIRVARGVNSLQTTSETDPEDFKKIKIVDVIDHIATDISETIKNDWIGQYQNIYDNKCLLVSACQEYLDELVARSILSEAKIEIDVAANKEYLEKKKVDTKDMTDDQLKQANTGEHVFLKATIKILDAMEEFDIEFTI